MAPEATATHGKGVAAALANEPTTATAQQAAAQPTACPPRVAPCARTPLAATAAGTECEIRTQSERTLTHHTIAQTRVQDQRGKVATVPRAFTTTTRRATAKPTPHTNTPKSTKGQHNRAKHPSTPPIAHLATMSTTPQTKQRLAPKNPMRHGHPPPCRVRRNDGTNRKRGTQQG